MGKWACSQRVAAVGRHKKLMRWLLVKDSVFGICQHSMQMHSISLAGSPRTSPSDNARVGTMSIPNSATLLHLVPTSPNLRLRASRDGSYPAHVSPSTVDGRLGVEIGFHRKLQKTIGGGQSSNNLIEALTAVWTNRDLELVSPQHIGFNIAFEVLFQDSETSLELQVHQAQSRTAGHAPRDNRHQQGRMTISREGGYSNEQGLEHRVLLPYGINMSIEVAGCAVALHWNASIFSKDEVARNDVLRRQVLQGHLDRMAAEGNNFYKLVTGSRLPNSYYADGVRVDVRVDTKDCIGRGSCGTQVHKAKDGVSGKFIAVKTLRISGSQASSLHVQMLREIDGYTRTSYAHVSPPSMQCLSSPAPSSTWRGIAFVSSLGLASYSRSVI